MPRILPGRRMENATRSNRCWLSENAPHGSSRDFRPARGEIPADKSCLEIPQAEGTDTVEMQ